LNHCKKKKKLKRHGLENPRKNSFYLSWITLKIQTIYKNKVALGLLSAGHPQRTRDAWVDTCVLTNQAHNIILI
jgi:hypothetical protein